MPLFRRAERAYDKRSSVVHGEGGRDHAAAYTPLIHEAKDWLREALVLILRSPEYLYAFETAEKRDAYCARLVFGEVSQPSRATTRPSLDPAAGRSTQSSGVPEGLRTS